MKRRMERALLFVVALSMLIAMLPGAALGEAGAVVAKKPSQDGPDVNTAYMLLRENENLPQLPEGVKPVDKIIPRRCMIVKHNYEFTIPVVVSPATLGALKDLAISWNPSKLNYVGVKCGVSSNRVTLYLRFTAIGKPTDTTQVTYRSLTRKAAQSRTYVTIVPTPVKSVQLIPPEMTMPANFVMPVPLMATVLPLQATNKAVKWYSSNPSVATVSSTGVVTSHAVGKATIFVVTVSGHKKAKCQVTVINAPPPVA